MTRPLVVAIDGPAASGKTTVGRAVALRLGLPHIDTGAMYRALALKALRGGVPVDDDDGLERLAARTTIELRGGRVVLDGEDVTEEIRSPPVTAAVSPLAVHQRVRRWMVERQRLLVKEAGAVVEGRDVGTVVLPDADVKVFLTATPAERARRRVSDIRASGAPARTADVQRDIEERDRRDATRSESPLAAASDAVVIDSTGRSVEEVTSEIERMCRQVHWA